MASLRERSRRQRATGSLQCPVTRTENKGTPAPSRPRAAVRHATTAAGSRGPPLRILLAIDDAALGDVLRGHLGAWGHHVVRAASAAEARSRLDAEAFDVVLASGELPPRTSAESPRPSATRAPIVPPVRIRVVPGEPQAVSAAFDEGVEDVLVTPVREAELLAHVRRAERARRVEQALLERTWRLALAERDASRDLEAAAVMQRALLPPPAPELPGLAAAWRFAPCRGVAGDVVGVHALDVDHASFYLVDVAGHGVPAAMLAFSLSRMLMPGRHGGALGACAGLADGPGILGAPADLLAGLNDRFPDDGESTRYFTLVYGVWDSARRIARVAQAGHPAPIVQRGTVLLPLQAEGRPIGLFPNSVYDELEIELRPGERLFLYSDGVTEARSAAGEPFGVTRLLATLREARGGSLEQAAAAVDAAIARWSDGTARRDDITLLALEAA